MSPTPEGEKIARRLLEEAWPKYEAALPTIRAGAAAMRPEPLAMLRAVTAVLKPAAPVEVEVRAYVGGFDGNAFAYGETGKPGVAVPVEMAEDHRAIILPHEMTHAVHMLTANLSGGWERSIALTVLQEGLAGHVSREVTPGREVRDYMEFTPGWWDAVSARRRDILQAIASVLERKDSDSVFRFTVGRRAERAQARGLCRGLVGGSSTCAAAACRSPRPRVFRMPRWSAGSLRRRGKPRGFRTVSGGRTMLITTDLRLVTVVAAVVGALATALISAGLLIGVAWAFLFGDDPWPRWYWVVQYLAAAGVGLYAGWWIARALWRRLSAAQARSRAMALAQTTLVLGVSTLVIVWLVLEQRS